MQAANGVGTAARTPTVTITVSAPAPVNADLQMTFTGPATVTSGSAGTDGVSARNIGTTSNAVDVEVSLSVPTGSTVGPLPSGVTQVGSTLVLGASTLAPGKNVTFSVAITLPSTQTLTASVTSDTPDPAPDDNTASLTTKVR